MVPNGLRVLLTRLPDAPPASSSDQEDRTECFTDDHKSDESESIAYILIMLSSQNGTWGGLPPVVRPPHRGIPAERLLKDFHNAFKLSKRNLGTLAHG